MAALDLGSNSFHLVVANYEQGQLRVVDRLNDYVRLGAGLDERNRITDEKLDEAMQCLSRMAQRIRHINPVNIRTVGTNALRRAKNRNEFVQRGEQILGHSIEVISGKEEARLIYAGVSRSRASGSDNKLVVDIGGGSTEFIIGSQTRPIYMESLFMGSVEMTRRFFADGKVTRKRMDSAILAATIELLPIVAAYREQGWDAAIGSSGPIKSILRTVQEAGWCKNLITVEGLRNLTRTIVDLGTLTPKNLPGLSDKRAPVFAGGVAILNACFKQLGIEKMEVSDAALREGVLYDLIGRRHHQDIREESVELLSERYHVDHTHADRVVKAAMNLFRQCADAWQLTAAHQRLLKWGAGLHEIGLDISHHQYHKHGAYVIANTDLTGFSLPERSVLAALVRGHRRKLSDAVFQNIPANALTTIERLVVLLRLALIIGGHRSPDPLPDVKLRVFHKQLSLVVDGDWLASHPLTRTQIEAENDFLSSRGYNIDLVTSSD